MNRVFQDLAESRNQKYKLAIADMLYEARRLPASDYRKLIAIAERVGVQWTGNPMDYARSPEPGVLDTDA